MTSPVQERRREKIGTASPLPAPAIVAPPSSPEVKKILKEAKEEKAKLEKQVEEIMAIPVPSPPKPTDSDKEKERKLEEIFKDAEKRLNFELK